MFGRLLAGRLCVLATVGGGPHGLGARRLVMFSRPFPGRPGELTIIGGGLHGWAVAHPIVLPVVAGGPNGAGGLTLASHARLGPAASRVAALTIVGGNF
jgi:hypothetical protein